MTSSWAPPTHGNRIETMLLWISRESLIHIIYLSYQSSHYLLKSFVDSIFLLLLMITKLRVIKGTICRFFLQISVGTAEWQMLIFMSWIQFFLFLNLLKINSSFVKLFNTENAPAVQSYDCVYYTNLTAGNNQSTPYCIRTAESISLDRSFSVNTCGSFGKEWTFRTLKESNVSLDKVLGWNSSIEIVDRYAAYLTTGYVDHTYHLIIISVGFWREFIVNDQKCNRCTVCLYAKCNYS